MVSFTSRPLYPQRKSPWYPLGRRLGEYQSRSGRGGEEKNSQPQPKIEHWNPDKYIYIYIYIQYNLCSSPNIVAVSKPRRIIKARHLADMGETRNAYKNLVG
jgi:hypothetical protein